VASSNTTSRGSLRKRRAFLAAYAEYGSIRAAAKAAGMDRSNHYEWMKDVPGYAAAFEEADARSGDALEDEATRRAHEGVLHDLLGVVVRAAEHLARVADQTLGVALVDGIEGAVVAGADEVDELFVAGGPVGGRVKEDRHGSRFGPGDPRAQPPEGHTWPPEVGHP